MEGGVNCNPENFDEVRKEFIDHVRPSLQDTIVGRSSKKQHDSCTFINPFVSELHFADNVIWLNLDSRKH